MESYNFLLFLAIILISTKVLGLVSKRVHMPQVVGALLAGIILGPSFLGIISLKGTTGTFLECIAEVGVIFLMFSAGLGTELNELKENWVAALIVATIGVIVPIVGGFLGYAFFFHVPLSDYTEFLKAKNKGRFRKEHTAEIQAYEEARDWLKSFYPDGKMLPIKTLKEQKASLQEQIDQQKSSIRSLKDLTQDLRTVDKNVEAILNNQVPKKQKTQEPEL